MADTLPVRVRPARIERLTRNQNAVLDWLLYRAQLGDADVPCRDIASQFGLARASQAMGTLIRRGLVKRTRRGHYALTRQGSNVAASTTRHRPGVRAPRPVTNQATFEP